VKLLLEAGANPNRSESNVSLLADAINSASDETVQLLLEHGADVNGKVVPPEQMKSPDWDGEPPLVAAVFKQDHALVDQLLAAGADPNVKWHQFTALALAQTAEYDELAADLRRAGAKKPDAEELRLAKFHLQPTLPHFRH
jgi:ankyrin repeat protein